MLNSDSLSSPSAGEPKLCAFCGRAFDAHEPRGTLRTVLESGEKPSSDGLPDGPVAFVVDSPLEGGLAHGAIHGDANDPVASPPPTRSLAAGLLVKLLVTLTAAGGAFYLFLLFKLVMDLRIFM